MSTAKAPKSSPTEQALLLRHPRRGRPRGRRAIAKELDRQQNEIELIASENIVSRAVLEAAGTCSPTSTPRATRPALLRRLPVRRHRREPRHRPRQAALQLQLRQRAAELRQPGQPGRVHGARQARRHHHGAQPRPRRAPHPRRQPSTSRASGSRPCTTGCAERTSASTSTTCAALAKEHKPRIIIAGGSAYPRHIDFAAFREIADEVGACFMVDMAHFAGLVAAGVHPSPSRTPTSSPRPRTRRCAVRAAA